MSQLSTPFLYEELVLPYDLYYEEQEKLHILANSRGVLEGHVRAIRISNSDYTEEITCLPLRRLIESLPNDTLHIFWYTPPTRVQHEDLKLLWKTQKRLTNLLFDFELNFTLDSPPASDIVREDSLELRSLVSISQIRIHFEEGALDPYALVLLSMMTDMFPNLQVLMLHYRLENLNRPLPEGLILPRTLLSRCLPRTLTRISFYCVKFEYANEVPLDGFNVLRHLDLVECDAVGNLLDNFSRPALETFTYRHSCIDQITDTRVSTTVDEFLQRFHHLKRLILDCLECVRPYESTAVSSITSHAASLEYLLVNCDNPYLHQDSFLEAVSKCKRLKQLSISFSVSDNIELVAVR